MTNDERSPEIPIAKNGLSSSRIEYLNDFSPNSRQIPHLPSTSMSSPVRYAIAEGPTNDSDGDGFVESIGPSIPSHAPAISAHSSHDAGESTDLVSV